MKVMGQEELAGLAERNAEATSVSKGIVFPRRTFILSLLVGAFVARFYDIVKFEVLDASDSEVRSVLEINGIRNVGLMLLFGSHSLNDETRAIIEEKNVKVLTGEFAIDAGISRKASGSPAIPLSPVLEHLISNITSFSTSVSRSDLFSLSAARNAFNLMELYKQGVAICSTEGSNFHCPEQSDKIIEASRKGQLVDGIFYTLAFITTLAFDLRDLMKNIWSTIKTEKLSRRKVLKMGLKFSKSFGAIAAGASLLYLVNSIAITLIERGELSDPANMPTTGFYSKLFSARDDVKAAILEFAFDEGLANQFKRLRKLRNMAMALNLWYLVNLFENNESLRSQLTGDDSVLKVCGMYGSGHAGLKKDFLQGPQEISKRFRREVDELLSSFLSDVDEMPSNVKEIIDFYADILGSFSSPRLRKAIPVSFHASSNSGSIVDTSQLLVYQELQRRLDLERTQDRRRSLSALFGQLLKSQIKIDLEVVKRIYGQQMVSYLSTPRSYNPMDDQTLQRRIIATGLIPDDFSRSNCLVSVVEGSIEVNYLYFGEDVGDMRKVRLLFINNIPIPFFDKEKIPESIVG